jgi:multidrug resistance efflux pump
MEACGVFKPLEIGVHLVRWNTPIDRRGWRDVERLTGSDMNKLTVATMQVEALRKQVTDAQATIAALQAQLPEKMQHCTIVFKECEKGHGRLTATNWIDHGCDTCRIEQRTAELERVSLLSSHNERRFEEVDKKYKELRALILALPKVEGDYV